MPDETSPSAAASRGAAVASGGDHEREPMTSQQADRLRALTEEHGETFDQTLSRDEAEARIAELEGRDRVMDPKD